MKTISSKKSKHKKIDKKKLKHYWGVIYPKDYVDVLVGHSAPFNLKKSANKSDVMLKGTLKQQDDGFCYLDISNNVIHGLFTLIDDENAEKPPYFGADGIGAHVSVISSDEGEKIKDVEIKELGQEFNFKLDKIVSVDPDGWDEMDQVWFIELDAPELGELRRKYKLPKTYNSMGHKFHITIAVRKKK